jgi:hypothetical protein
VTSPSTRASARHWNELYAERGTRDVSWFEASPAMSLRLIDDLDLPADTPVLDVGAGASGLIDGLLDRGHRDVRVLDVPREALDAVRTRLEQRPDDALRAVELIEADLLAWRPDRAVGLWHDRAVFHFLTSHADRARYRDQLTCTVDDGGHIVIATFAEDGPQQCSGLPVACYDADTLAAELGPRFAVVHRDRQVHHTPAGDPQPFTWLVLRRLS